jgi:hypothetical protein
MAAHNLLVVLLSGATRLQLRGAVERYGEEWPEVHVVAPVRIGAIDWLATDEDAARAEADARALEAEWILADEGDVEGEAGDLDAVQAVEDALRSFPADEILLVGSGEDGTLEAAMGGFGLPVRRIGVPREGAGGPLRRGARAFAAGRSRATPFVAFALANLFLLLAAVVISVIVLLVVWLS